MQGVTTRLGSKGEKRLHSARHAAVNRLKAFHAARLTTVDFSIGWMTLIGFTGVLWPVLIAAFEPQHLLVHWLMVILCVLAPSAGFYANFRHTFDHYHWYKRQLRMQADLGLWKHRIAFKRRPDPKAFARRFAICALWYVILFSALASKFRTNPAIVAALLIAGSVIIVGLAQMDRAYLAQTYSLASDRCPRCLYDMRQSADRCPECGWSRALPKPMPHTTQFRDLRGRRLK